MQTYTKAFSREKTLMHFEMWAVSEHAGAQAYVGQAEFSLVFFKPSFGSKIGIWQSDEVQTQRLMLMKERLLTDTTLWPRIKHDLDAEWTELLPYLARVRSILSIEDLSDYMARLTRWWVPMSVTYFIPDIPELHPWHEEALAERRKTEIYAEVCDELVTDFWKQAMPAEYQDLAEVSTIEEASLLMKRALSVSQVAHIRERLNGYAIVDEKVYTLLELPEALRLADVELKEDVVEEKVIEVRGRVANTGKITGTAKIVIKKADLGKVQARDVIVAEMTNPDYLPWMKIAAAFVTDEGGMTCHAAIVARELQKPCVVGTKVATKVFKDGDLVEVNATSGIVRKLE